MNPAAPIDASMPEGMALLMAELDAVQKHNRRVLRKLSPLQTHLLERRLRMGRWPVNARMAVTPRTGERSRERRPAGARRSASSSRTSSADPGDSDPAGSEPPPRRRFTVDKHFVVVSLEAIA